MLGRLIVRVPVLLRAARAMAACAALTGVLGAPTAAHAQGIQFPAGAGIVNVRDFGAVGNGIADDTAALNAALASARANGSSAKFIYIPDGVYRVTNTVAFNESRTTLQGQSMAGTIIRLDANAAGYNTPDGSGGFVAKRVLSTREFGGFSANEFVNSIFDLTIEVGAGNPGAVALRYHNNNQGTLRNVTLRALSASTGNVGLDILGNDKGPGMVRNVTIEGFRLGVDFGGTEYSMVFENLTLRNQREYGMLNYWNMHTIRGLVSVNAVPVLWNDLVTINNFPWGMMTIIDGVLTTPGGAPVASAALLSNTSLYLRNVTSTGYTSLVRQNNVDQPFTGVAGEWTSDRAFSVFNSRAAMLNLPVLDTPEVPWDAPATPGAWASVTSFGAVANDNADDSAAFQAAIDSGATTVYAPIGRYVLANQVVLRGSVRRLFLTQGQVASIAPLRGSSTAMFTMGPAGAPVVVVERADFDSGSNTPPVENAGSGRTLVLRNSGASNVRLSGAGTTFVEDVVGGPWTISSGHIGYFRQCNPENSGVKITNSGATLWLMGLKTEAQGTPLLTQNGGTTELIGGNIYPVQTLPLDQPLIKTIDSRVSAIIGGSAYSFDAYHRVFAEETRAGVLRRIFSFEVPGRVGFFIGPRVAFYAADTLNPPPAASGPFSHYPLNQTSGTTVPDITGGPSGTAVNGPAWVPAQIGNGLTFDGVDDYVDLPPNRGNSAQGSVSLWARTTTDFNDVGIMFYATSSTNPNANGAGGDPEMQLSFIPDENVLFFIPGPSGNVFLTSGRPLNDGRWHHIVATWDLQGYADLYVDGQRTASTKGSWVNFNWQTVTRLGRPSGNTRRYQGSLDDVRTYTRPISHAEVNDLFDAGRGYANYPPNVTASIDQSVQDVSYTAQLNGQAVDDNQPFGPPTIAWSVVSAPPSGTVNFANPADPRTAATFSKQGTYILRLTISDGVEARFDELTVNVFDPLPAPWDNADQGDTGAFGWAAYATPSRFTLNSAGTKIDGFPAAGCDGFHFAYVPAGNVNSVNIIARVTSVQNTNPSARAGVMFRQELGVGCTGNAFVGVTATGDVVASNRSGAFGGTDVYATVPGVGFPVWVRLLRLNANQVQAFYSTNGSNWISLGSPVVNTGTLSTYFGLAHSAYNFNTIGVAQFDNVLFSTRLPCAGDADRSGSVNFDDITTVLGAFGNSTQPGTAGPGDANLDTAVNFDDITTVLGSFGNACP